MTNWSLQDAKSKFGDLVDAALEGEPQQVTRRGQPAVVVLSVKDYERLCRSKDADIPTFSELLLQIPQDNEEFERLHLPDRPLDLY